MICKLCGAQPSQYCKRSSEGRNLDDACYRHCQRPLSWEKASEEKRTALYRHFDSTGVLLYVGVSNNPVLRFDQHSRDKAWIEEVARIEVEWFSSRETALVAEKNQIIALKPVYNVVHTARFGQPQSRGWVVGHHLSGFVNGIFFDRRDALSLCTWFSEEFPKEDFAVLDCAEVFRGVPRRVWGIPESHYLEFASWYRWCASEPPAWVREMFPEPSLA